MTARDKSSRSGDQLRGVIPIVSNEELMSVNSGPRPRHQRREMEGCRMVRDGVSLRRAARLMIRAVYVGMDPDGPQTIFSHEVWRRSTVCWLRGAVAAA